MKKITLLMIAVLAINFNFAQSVVFSDDFNDEDISDWTLIDSDGDGNNFGDQFAVTNASGGAVTPISLISRSWQTVPLLPDNWAISPAFDLSGTSGTITVEYVTQVAAEEWDEEKYSIHVGTSNDIAVLVNATNSLTETLGDFDDTGVPVSHSLDISSLAGSPQVYIAFRHWDCTDKDFLSIDDLTVNAATLSVDQFAVNAFSHNFNKTTDLLTLESNEAILESVKIHNILGQNVLNKTLASTNEVVDMSSMQDGIYLVTVAINGSSKTFKILKN